MFYRRIIPFRIVSRNSPHSLLDAIALYRPFYFIDITTSVLLRAIFTLVRIVRLVGVTITSSCNYDVTKERSGSFSLLFDLTRRSFPFAESFFRHLVFRFDSNIYSLFSPRVSPRTSGY